jgi:hypothetical protein
MVGNLIAEATRCRAESDDLCGYTHGPTADRRPDLLAQRRLRDEYLLRLLPSGRAR